MELEAMHIRPHNGVHIFEFTLSSLARKEKQLQTRTECPCEPKAKVRVGSSLVDANKAFVNRFHQTMSRERVANSQRHSARMQIKNGDEKLEADSGVLDAGLFFSARSYRVMRKWIIKLR
jgi:hypothetical protein